MATQFEKLKKELDDLDIMGHQLYFSMAKECEQLNEKTIKNIQDAGWKFVKFRDEYQKWYTKAYRVISQIIPERLAEFEAIYKGDPKRKDITYMNYSVSDYLVGLQQTNGLNEVVRSPKDAIRKMEIQYKILSSAKERFKSTLFDIKDIVQADIFDSELETAKELNKKGFIRAAGAVTGVVLEKHLAHVCSLHALKSRKSHPSIAEFNQLLKDNDVVDTPVWRFIQHLCDIRNLCDHGKEREPTKEEVSEFISGVDKITKTVF
ncbi:hypothetical protein HLB02_14045 [Serratia nevei]|jgi:hypothetical protein|uniref:hypothetical protein n=1 Tax=Serratia TaxID=613 RepID=UPI001084090B|nr:MULTISPECIES: hypothetical protein [Serratia]MBL0874498.1 hypothetical protein [Serratia nevei]MDV5745464.1 hypothetical protein [Serratia marcescens]MDV5750375.1 hypothetical protein [Serratia marcescens]MDV5781813.1 hypothetical protein [Serratia marcescens]MDV5786755.1 hypothetical protein [Serratia marcescens]